MPAIAAITLGAQIDMDRFDSLENTHLRITAIGTHGTSPIEYVGDTQATSGVDGGGEEVINPYEFYFEKNFRIPKLSMLVGLYDFSTEFNINSAAAHFIHASLGTTAALGSSGVNGPGIFPLSNTALRIRHEISPGLEWMYGVSDGVPADKSASYQNQLEFNTSDGLFSIIELKSLKENSHELAIGGWQFSKKIPTLYDDGLYERSQGVYLIAQYQFGPWFIPFIRFETANGSVQIIKQNLAIGFISQSLFSPNDRLGVHFSKVSFSDSYLQLAPLKNYELATELMYSYQLGQKALLVPHYQNIRHPSGNPNQAFVHIFGLRLSISL